MFLITGNNYCSYLFLELFLDYIFNRKCFTTKEIKVGVTLLSDEVVKAEILQSHFPDISRKFIGRNVKSSGPVLHLGNRFSQ